METFKVYLDTDTAYVYRSEAAARKAFETLSRVNWSALFVVQVGSYMYVEGGPFQGPQAMNETNFNNLLKSL